MSYTEHLKCRQSRSVSQPPILSFPQHPLPITMVNFTIITFKVINNDFKRTYSKGEGILSCTDHPEASSLQGANHANLQREHLARGTR